MAFLSTAWYVNSAGYGSIAAWSANQTWGTGQLIRQSSPTNGNERVFVCIVAGAGSTTTEPTWALTKGAKTTDNAATWMECSGMAGLNGDSVNTPAWAASGSTALGQIVKNVAGGADTLFICTTSSGNTSGSEPSWSKTLGSTTADGSNVWTSLGSIASQTKWVAPHARLSIACTATWAAAGDVIYVADNHASTSSTIAEVVVFPGTAAAPNYCFCVNHAGSVPPVSADLATTGSLASTLSVTGDVKVSGHAYIYGLSFKSGASDSAGALQFLTTGASGYLHLDGCSLVLTANNALINFGTANNTTGLGKRMLLTNTTMSFAGTSDAINFANIVFRWANTQNALAGAAVPTTLIGTGGAGTVTASSVVVIDGVDLSAAGSGKTLVGAQGCANIIQINSCKLGSGVTVAATPSEPTAEITVTNSDSANTTYRGEKYAYAGTLTTDTTDIRAGGASDGTTPIAWKVVTTTNASKVHPFEAIEIAIWNNLTGSSRTASIAIMSNATLTTADIWPEVEYLGDASFPDSALASGRVADLLPSSSGSAWATDGVSSWTTTGVTGPVQQTLSVSFTPQQVGWIRVKVKVAKASQTLRIDPVVTVT